jgi:hypothetical protein
MNNKFDELTKSLAQSVSRRAALKKFGVGLAGMALACFGLANRAEAQGDCGCVTNADCLSGNVCASGFCVPAWCHREFNYCCCQHCKTYVPSCDAHHHACKSICKQSVFTCP